MRFPGIDAPLRRDAGAVASQRNVVPHQARQMQVLLQSNRWSPLATLLLVAFVFWMGQRTMDWQEALAWCLPLLITAPLYLFDSLRHRHASLDELGRPAFRYRFLGHVTGQGICYGLMYIGIYPHLDLEDQTILALAATAALPIGAFTVAAMQEMGVAWVVSLSIMLTVNSLLVGNRLHDFLAVAVMFMGVVSTITVVSISHGLRARLRAEQEANDGREALGVMLSEIESQSEDWVWSVDTDHHLVHATPQLRQAIGQAAEEPLTACPLFERLASLARAANPDQPALASIGRHLTGCVAMRNIELRLIPAGNNSAPAIWSISGIPVHNGSGIIHGWLGVIRDMTVLRTQAEELHRLAHIDTLTGLANRHVLMSRCELELGRQMTAGGWLPLSLFLLDLDDFKNVNDSFGHHTGDRLLQEVGRLFTQAVAALLPAESVVLARFGGDEFALLITQAHSSQAREDIADALAASLHPTWVDDTLRFDLRVSIGVTSWTRPATRAESLLQEADVALYEAKAVGGGVMRVYEDAMGAKASRHAAFSKEIGQLLAHDGNEGFEPGQAGELLMFYQPQIDLKSGQMVGAEALIRWRHPCRGWISPAEFIPVAEDTGLIVRLGRWVLERSCCDAARWSDDLYVAVNVSGHQFSDPGLVPMVHAVLQKSGLPPGRLELEITETALMDSPSQAHATLAELRQLGVRIALDDFGTG
jgi:diguanylate cyclase (GGDEF)-like protein